MPDVYAAINDADPVLVSRIAEVLELRAADPQQQAMRRAYLDDIDFPDGAEVLEVGCGTGAVTREPARRPGVAKVTGIDPSPTFLAAARDLDPPANCTFVEGTPAPWGSPAARSTWSCSTPPCATSPGRSWPLTRPPGCCAPAGGWPSSTATTSPPPWPPARPTPSRPAPRGS